MKVSICLFCKHLNADGDTCRAFPEGIPAHVYSGDHSLPHPDDHGIQFEAIEGAESSFFFFDASLLARNQSIDPGPASTTRHQAGQLSLRKFRTVRKPEEVIPVE